MNRRQLAAAALLPLVVRSAPAALISKTWAATLEHEEKMNEPKQRIIESNGIVSISLSRARGLWYCWPTAFPSPGTRGGTKSACLPRAASMSWLLTCAATAKATPRRPSTSTQCCIWSAIWSGFSMRSTLRPPRLSVTTGVRAWRGAALIRPDRFRAVAALSVPFRPRGAASPTTLMPRTENAQFYQLYFQEPGPAEAELGRDPRAAIRNILFGGSGEGGAAARASAASGELTENLWMVPKGAGSCGVPARRKHCHRGSAKATSISTKGNSNGLVSAAG